MASNIKKFTFNPFGVNSYLIWNFKNEAIIIDPGCLYDDENLELEGYLRENKIRILSALITHAHLDHVFGCEYIKNRYGAKIYLPKEDLELYNSVEKQASQFGLNFGSVPEADYLIESEEREITLQDFRIKVLHTPGHSPGEVCFYFERENICFTGDVLFAGSIGRTDLWMGSSSLLLKSIEQKLFRLPPNTIVLPGHGENTTIINEKLNNPFFKKF